MTAFTTLMLAVLIMFFIFIVHAILTAKPTDSVEWLWFLAIGCLWFIINCPIFSWSVYGGI